jgi:hypothetical protein
VVEWESWERADTERSLCSGLRLFRRACSQNEEAIETVFFFDSIDMLYLHPTGRTNPAADIGQEQLCKVQMHPKVARFSFLEVHTLPTHSM